MYYIVYKTTNLINHKIYIGFHATEDVDDNYLGSGVILKKAVAKYGRDNFTRELLYVFNTPEEAFEKEIESIELLCPEYNITQGGQGRRGPFSEETRRKLSEASRGRKLTEEAKQKLRDFNVGKKHTEETKQKISKALKGKPLSEENKRNIGLANKGKKRTEEQLHRMSETTKRWRKEKYC